MSLTHYCKKACSVLAVSPLLASTAAQEAAPMPETLSQPAPFSGRVMSREEVMKELGPTTGLFSADAAYKDYTVSDVVVRYKGSGGQVDRSRILDRIATRRGSKYNADVVNRDLERLVEDGLVSGDTVVIAEPTGGNSVRVVFEVSSQKLMGGVGFTGNSSFDSDDLAEETGLVGGQVLSDLAISEAITKLRRYYQDSRYPDAVIQYRFIPTPREGYVDVIFDIQEGKHINVTDIDFTGNTHYDDKQLRNVLETKERGWLTWITKSGMMDRERWEDDLAALVSFYRNEGYLRARIVKVEQYVNESDNDQDLRFNIVIDEGKRYRVRNVAFGPTKVFTAEELVPGLSMYNGDAYSGQKVADDVTMIRRYYGSRGYADASVSPDIQEVGTDANGYGLIDIVYRIEEGDHYRVGNISITGNTKSKDYVIRRELPLQSNDPLNTVDLEIAQKRLNNLNYYDDVSVQQASSLRPGYRDVNIEVTERRTGTFNIGVAFSSVESVYLFAGVTQSNFDLYDWNSFVGGGQRFALNTRIGSETKDATLSWLDPWFLDRQLAFETSLFYADSTYYSDFYDQVNYGFAVSLRKPLGDLDSIKLEYRLENYSIDTHYGAPLYFLSEDGDSVRSHIELSYRYDSRDAQIFPRKGGKFEVLAGYSGLGGDAKTYNLGINFAYYWNLRWDTIFSINGGLATVKGVDDDYVPIYERLYLGGPYNMRGFRFRDVGVHDEILTGDETMGGRSSAYCQFELSIPVIEEVRVAVFYDIGFIHEDAFDFSGDTVASDFGVGLRLNMPMGPLAVDYAIPIQTGNAIDSNGRFQFYLNYSY